MNRKTILCSILLNSMILAAGAESATTLTIQTDEPSKVISPDLFGIFFEDISYAADGGLYAELIQNRSFEYSPNDNKRWNSLTCWDLVQRGGAKGSVEVQDNAPLNANNPHYAVLSFESGAGEVGLQNIGFDGIVLKQGEKYDFSLFAKQLAGTPGSLQVRLESKTGELLGEATLPPLKSGWQKYSITIQASNSADSARLVLLSRQKGKVALDMVSLFPQKTFHNRPNGLRADLAQVIADIHPKFMRFPGGCLTHGDGLDNIYHWKNTIGPVEQRKAQRNTWRYHQTTGLGYFEYFQFCEDIGAKPVPVVAAGVCCQNSGHYIPGSIKGPQGLPMDQMPSYIQEVLDLIEYANGPASSVWGSKRAAAGHPQPFHLEYLGVGNEDAITPAFRERFKLIYDAVKAKHPEITVIGTVGPFPTGRDFDEGWKVANELSVPIVDEHYYMPPQWFLSNFQRYDHYDRSHSKVYIGEYAAHDDRRRPTLRSAITEAAYMTQLERNGDVVHMASYAPLLAKEGHINWSPDLIYFNNTRVALTINYYVQQLFATNSGDTWLPVTMGENTGLVCSAVRDRRTGSLILKIVNPGATPVSYKIAGIKEGGKSATKYLLTGDPMAVNELSTPQPLIPTKSIISISSEMDAPPCSLTVIRIGS